jgi:CBS domain-containing protein
MLPSHTIQRCVTLGPNTSVAEALRRLRQSDASFVVVEENSEYAVLAERDLARSVPNAGWDLKVSHATRQEYLESIAVRSICQLTPETASPRATAAAATDKMRRRQLALLPVVAEGRVLGVIGMFGFVDTILRRLVARAAPSSPLAVAA